MSKKTQTSNNSSEEEHIEYPNNLDMLDFRWEVTEFIKIVAAIRTDERLSEHSNIVDSENIRD